MQNEDLRASTPPDSSDELQQLIEERNNRVRQSKKRLIHVARVKNYIRSHQCEINEETIEAIDRKLYEIIDAAIKRTKSNKRKTLRPYDL